MVIQLDLEVWVDDGRAIVGKIKEVKTEFVVLVTLQGKRIAVDRAKIRPIRELYGV